MRALNARPPDHSRDDHYPVCRLDIRQDSRDEHGSGLKPILAGSGLDRTAIFLKIGGPGLDRTEKIFVVLVWLFLPYQKF